MDDEDELVEELDGREDELDELDELEVEDELEDEDELVEPSPEQPANRLMTSKGRIFFMVFPLILVIRALGASNIFI